MKKYYKIISAPFSRFEQTYNVLPDTNLSGQQFTAKSFDKDAIEANVALNAPEFVLHFCDKAIDTLMWMDCCMNSGLFKTNAKVYEIKPLSFVYKQQCNDKNALWQCGANKIEFVCQLDKIDLLRDAVAETDRDFSKIIMRYPNRNMLKMIMDIQNSRHLTVR